MAKAPSSHDPVLGALIVAVASRMRLSRLVRNCSAVCSARPYSCTSHRPIARKATGMTKWGSVRHAGATRRCCAISSMATIAATASSRASIDAVDRRYSAVQAAAHAADD